MRTLPNETANKQMERTQGSGTTSPTHYFQQPQDAHFPSVTLSFQSLVHFDLVRSCTTSSVFRLLMVDVCVWLRDPWQMFSYILSSKSSLKVFYTSKVMISPHLSRKSLAEFEMFLRGVWLSEAIIYLFIDFVTPHVTHRHICTTLIVVLSS